MDSYNKQVIFHLPGVFRFFNGYQVLLSLIKDRPYIVKDNIKIGSIYGSPQCIWNGGRLVLKAIFDKHELEYIKQVMSTFNIPVRFTFTNCLLDETHTFDTYGNLLLEIFNTGKNEVICNSPILEDYIRNKYKNRYKYISSTTKRLNNCEEQTKELQKDYYLIVLDYDHNKNYDYLSSIENKSKCEILCNPVCKPFCAKRTAHYKNISQCQLEYNSNDRMQCHDAFLNFWQTKKNKAFISIEDINNIYIPLGFKNFKLEGRTTHPMDWVEIILYYLIKEEYKDEVRSKLQQAVW